ncbi:MAG TPA: peptidase C1 [Candidatus Aquabacterium excrementipullorum]|nr:peptidase C1 [Candidatus Aquabacterium excrementipullorum]
MSILLVRGSQGAEVKRLKQQLVKQLGEEAATYAGLTSAGDVLDADVEAAVRRWQSGVGIVADGVVGPRCQELLGLRVPVPLALNTEPSAVRQLFPATKPANITRYAPYVAAALGAAGLTDRAMICAALGTIRAESEGFVPISEMPSQFNTKPGQAPFSAYEGRKNLGNVKAGDGPLFKGRGFVQLTGRANYHQYSATLGIDLEAAPDLANAPEVAAVLLATFLADRAKPMREAIAAHNHAAARKLVNGGSHGLDRFREVFELADKLWPGVQPVAVAAKAGGKRKVAAGKKTLAATQAAAPAQAGKRNLTVRKDPSDLRDRAYMPPPVSLLEEFPPSSEIKRFLQTYSKAGLILDQGQEGACTGFGLACVINYLRWRKGGLPAKMESVSPRMLYNFARRYDEYDGEDYDGSSCRGALKGWFNHGVCLETDWPYSEGAPTPKYGYAKRAAAHTLGVYFRVDLTSITDLQAAIQEVGAVYVSAFTHDGWSAIPNQTKPPANHDALPVIAFDGRPSETDGHAFALVGFNAQGFVIQNSWGTGWGVGGFAILTYADWLANAMDAWVVAMGVPGVVVGRVSAQGSGANGAAAGVNKSLWWSEDQAYRHSVVLGNDGRVNRYLTEDELSRTLLHQVAGLPDQWFRTQSQSKRKRLVLYAHGGLNREGAAISRVRAMGRHFIANDCYPLFLVWKTGLLESIGGMLSDTFRPKAAGVGEWLAERSDLLLEKTIGRPAARPIWSEMKENAELGFGSGRGGDLLITALQKLSDTWGDDFELHLVGHSAGSIILGHLITAMGVRGLTGRITSAHLHAPACTVAFANRHYAPQTELMKRLYVHLLSDRAERDDNVAAIYRKSLLYFVSNALEVDLRTPILGMENVFKPDYAGWDGTSATGDALKSWRQAAASAGLLSAQRLTVVDREKILIALPDRRERTSHGGFDNDIEVMTQTLGAILGGPLLKPVDDLRGF